MTTGKTVTCKAQSDDAKEMIKASGIRLWLELAK